MERIRYFQWSDDDDDVHFALDQHVFIWNNSPGVDMSPHSDKLSWFWVNQFLFLLIKSACIAHTNFIVFGYHFVNFPFVYAIANFLQHLCMRNIFLSWYDILELVFPIVIS